MPGRLAFVPPRFGDQVIGGAEGATRRVALGMAARGWDVEVLTSCAISHHTWDNDLPEGTTTEDGVTVRRWKHIPAFAWVGVRAQLKIQNGLPASIDEQTSWLSWRLRVPGLFEHLARHGHDYDAVVFAPYMFWTTTACLPLVAERAVVIPCLHDEPYAALEVLRPIFANPLAVWFLSEPEHEHAHRLGAVSHHRVTGMGVDVPTSYDPEGFRRRHGLGSRPFLLFAGRREPAKGWDRLLAHFTDAVRHHGLDVDLVTIGVGDTEEPDDIASRVIDLGVVDDGERDAAMAAALAYVQPSRLESFSLTTMEAWLAGTPVLTVEDSAVVSWHCHRSGGGLTYLDGASLAAMTRRLAEDPQGRSALAAAGRRYVLDNYTWSRVLDRMEADLGEVLTR
jgi:glycosyltransferase involved in cell wall biosynthesis